TAKPTGSCLFEQLMHSVDVMLLVAYGNEIDVCDVEKAPGVVGPPSGEFRALSRERSLAERSPFGAGLRATGVSDFDKPPVRQREILVRFPSLAIRQL